MREKVKRAAPVHDIVGMGAPTIALTFNDLPAREVARVIAFMSLLWATEFIERNLSEPFGPEDVARAACISVSQLNRLFGRVFGTSPASYILKRRLSRAARQLATTDRSITDIALDAQFGAPESFTRAFRRQYLVTPSAFRRSGTRYYDLYPPVHLASPAGKTEGSETMRHYDNTQVRQAILDAPGTYLMVADIDHLLHINESEGTRAGDAALAAVAGRIERSLDAGMHFFRTGNDDFTVLTGTDDRARVFAIAEAILEQANTPVVYEGGRMRVTCSIGIARISAQGQDAQVALDAAGRALVRAKRIGRDRYALFHDETEALGHILAAKGTYILLCDMDGLKSINDTLGYAAGDAAIAAMEARIRAHLGPDMEAWRTGGDEFTVLTGSTDEAACRALAGQILSHAQEDVAYPGGTLRVNLSVGIAQVPQDGEAIAQAAVERADAALLAAKRAGRGTVRIYDTAQKSPDGVSPEAEDA